MKIGFYLVWEGNPLFYVLADAMIRSVRQYMPEVEIVQMTDLQSPPVVGIDGIRRLPPAPLSVMRSKHYASVTGDWLFLDTDVLVQRDVRDVFKQDFDIAVTDRHTPKLDPKIEQKMPFPAGVVFSRCPAFWQAVHEEVLTQGAEQSAWYGDQMALATVIRRGPFRHIVLSGEIYQRPPKTQDEEISNAAIVHYKGPTRKPFLMDRIRQELSL